VHAEPAPATPSDTPPAERLSRQDQGFLAALLVPYLALVARYHFVCDDAFITWRYSKHVAMGYGPRYNLANEVPVEGYSDFLWMLIGAAVEAVGASPITVMPAISALCGVALIVWMYRFQRLTLGIAPTPTAAATLFAATLPPFAVWSTSGLETMPETLLLFGAAVKLWYGRTDRDIDLAALCALGLALIRTEGIAWCVVIAALGAAYRAWEGRPVQAPLLRFTALLLLPFSLYFAWRAWFYQSWVANTAKAKVHLEPVTLLRGLLYLALYALTLLSPLLLAAAAPAAWKSRWRKPVAPMLAMALAVPAYAVVVSGDYMAWFRILVPGVPFFVVVLGVAYQTWTTRHPRLVPAIALAAATLSLLPVADVHLVPEPWREAVSIREKLGFFRTENLQWAAMNEHVTTWTEKGIALREHTQPGETYVAAAIGATGYYSDLYIYDRNGLVNREVAELPWSGELRSPGHDKVVDRSFFFDKKPDILDAKVISGPRVAGQIRRALLEMEAEPVKRRYYPELIPLSPAERGVPRFLIPLRRAATPEVSEEKWAAFQAQWATFKTGRREDDEDDGGPPPTPDAP
jgi:arabinofuranosyltransferase